MRKFHALLIGILLFIPLLLIQPVHASNMLAGQGLADPYSNLKTNQQGPLLARPVRNYGQKNLKYVPQVTISTPSYPVGIGSRETKMVPYSLQETASVSGEITSSSWQFYTQYGDPLSGIIGPYKTSINVKSLQRTDWNELVYLPESVVEQALSLDEYALVLKTTYQGISSSGEKFTTEASTLLLLPPQAFSKDTPTDQATDQTTSLPLKWNSSLGAIDYEYCFDTIDNNSCDTNWTGTYWLGTYDTNTALQDLPDGTTFYWQVRANNTAGRTYANQGKWWSFTTACDTNLITVTNLQNSGAGSLRQAIADICPGGTINFAASLAGKTIILDSTLVLYKYVTIDGSALTSKISVSGNYSVPVFEIEPGLTATMKSLVITHGRAVADSFGNGYSGGIINFGDLTVVNCIVSENGSNFSVYANGGGIYTSGAGKLIIIGSTISNNTGYLGAGIFGFSELLQITDSTISGNRGMEGGGILLAGGNLEMKNSAVIDNWAELDGGGLLSQGIVSVSSSTFSGNHAGRDGGGIAGMYLTVINSTFYNNSAVSGGGGIASGSPLIVTNSTFSGNSSTTGGSGIHSTGNFSLTNTILANSISGSDCYNEAGSGAMTVNINNLIEKNAASPNNCGAPLLTSDPKLDALADNGGNTQTMALLPGSPAIDAGDKASCPATDQRGVKRPQGGTCDIGAYEDNTAPGVRKYDDSYSNWVYSGSSWLVASGSSFSNNSVHYTSGPGDTASFAFSGTQFKLTYTQATNRSLIAMSVDGKAIGTLNAYGPLVFQRVYTSPIFLPGDHVVQFRNAGGPGPYIDIDGIEILNVAAPGAGIYDDSHTNWSYDGASWLAASGSSFTNNSVHYTNGLGDSASFTFTGTQFVLTYTQATNRGSLEIYVDGAYRKTLNANGPLVFQRTYISPIFSSGTHVVQINNTGGSGPYIDIDSIQILNTSIPGAGSYDDADINWSYSGASWLVANSSDFSNNSVRYTNGLGDSASFLFNGTQFKLTYTQATNRGNLAIFVDGIQIDTLNEYGSLVFRKTYTSPVLLPAFHVVQFKNAGGSGPYIDIDGIQILYTPIPSAGTYDDSDSNWSYRGSAWLGANGLDFTNNSVHYTNGLGDSASFTFTGMQFKLTYTQAPNRGNIAIYLDGSLLTTLNENGQLGFQKTYISPAFLPGTHVLQFKNAGGPGPFIDIDGLQIFNDLLPGEGSYDDSSGNWLYQGSSWLVANSTLFTSNSVHYTNGPGDSASFVFNGTQFKLTYTQAANRGNLTIYVDGSQIGTLKENGSLAFRKIYTSPVFLSGSHIVQFKNAGGPGPYIDIDGIQILNTPAPGAGNYDDADVNWSYSGDSWLVASGSSFSNDSVHYTNGQDDSASFVFTGTQFILTYTQATNRGNTFIYVDGNLSGTLNANGPLGFQETYPSQIFPSGTHVVQFKNAGGSGPYIDIDGLEIK